MNFPKECLDLKKIHTMLIKTASFFFTIILLISCANTKTTNIPTPEEQSTIGTSNLLEITVIDFEMIERKNKDFKVSFQKASTIKGQLKESKIVYPSNKIGKFIVQLLDGEGEIIEELVIKEPYQQIIEEKEAQINEELINDQIRRNKFSVQYNRNLGVESIKILKMIDNQAVELYHHKTP